MPTRRRGFTLIELLVVIGIMLILIGLLWTGWSHIHGQAGANATRGTLQIADSMFGTYKAATNLQRQPSAMWQSTGTTATAVTFNPAQWQTDFFNTLAVAPQPEFSFPNGGPDPTHKVDPATPDVVRNTGIAWLMLNAMPENSAAINKEPSSVNQIVATPWSAGASYTAGQRVWDLDPTQKAARFYEATASVTGTEPPGGPWKEISSALIDAWNNPIIFVPSHGLYFVQDKGPATYSPSVTYQPGTRVTAAWTDTNNKVHYYIYTCIASNKGVTPPNPLTPNTDGSYQAWGGVCSPDLRPFWASAGPDGDFSNQSNTFDPSVKQSGDPTPGNGDDNLYSFNH